MLAATFNAGRRAAWPFVHEFQKALGACLPPPSALRLCLGRCFGDVHQSLTFLCGKGIGATAAHDSRFIPKDARISHKTLHRSAENTQNVKDARVLPGEMTVFSKYTGQ
jgi:hypothetical protein